MIQGKNKIAIMQPYFFPYIGYYQLVQHSDIFVSYNDVNFIEGGWINRNYIISPNGKHLFSVPLAKASPFKTINSIMVHSESGWKNKFKKNIELTYRRAPYFQDAFAVISGVIDHDQTTIDDLALRSVTHVFEYLGQAKTVKESSTLAYDHDGDKVQKVLAIAGSLSGDVILFPQGSKALYSKKEFIRQGFETAIVVPNNSGYKQFRDEFVPNLSIIDVLMFNSPESVCSMLSEVKFEALND